MWRLSWQSNTDLFNYSGCGWDFGVTIVWIHNPFPNKVYVFFDPVFDEDDYEFGNELWEDWWWLLDAHARIFKNGFCMKRLFNIKTCMILT